MRRSLVILNVVFYLICLVLFAVIVGLGYRGFEGIDTPRGMTGCFCTIGSWLVFMSCVPGKCVDGTVNRTKNVSLTLLLGLLFQIWIFGLALYRVAAYSKSTRRSLPEVLRLLLKDSISWFFMYVPKDYFGSRRLTTTVLCSVQNCGHDRVERRQPGRFANGLTHHCNSVRLLTSISSSTTDIMAYVLQPVPCRNNCLRLPDHHPNAKSGSRRRRLLYHDR